MPTLSEQLRFILHGAEVKRFHTFRTIDHETVGEHSFFVAWFCWLLTEGAAPAHLFVAALAHDLAEQEVGDMPAPSKRALGVGTQLAELEDRFLKQAGLYVALDEEEVRLLKRADCLAGLAACLREHRLGNRHIARVFRRYQTYIEEIQSAHPCAQTQAILSELIKFWHEEHSI